jgi:transposase
MTEKLNSVIAVIGIDIGKDPFHVVGLDALDAIVLRQKWWRGQVETRFANMPAYLIGMEARLACRAGEELQSCRRR